MATFLKSPFSPSSIVSSTFCVDTTRKHAARLSGATTFEWLNYPENYINTPTTLPDMPCGPIVKARRSSSASSTKSEMQRTNRTLTDMLENVQKELRTHRSMILDMQSRISQMERFPQLPLDPMTISNCKPATENPRESTTINESQTWWRACQTFAQNSDPPFTATEFLKPPRRFSGFDFNFDLQKAPPPELADVPLLTPTSVKDEPSPAIETPEQEDPVPAEPHDDIVERIVEFDKMRVPRPPKLQSPPRSLRSREEPPVTPEEEITALPPMPRPVTPVVVEVPVRQKSRIKSFFGYKMLRGRGPEKDKDKAGQRGEDVVQV